MQSSPAVASTIAFGSTTPAAGGLGEPAGQLLVPGAVEITDVQLVPAVVDTHLGELGSPWHLHVVVPVTHARCPRLG